MKTAPVVKLKCKQCGDIINSEYFGQYKRCSCGAIGIDEEQHYCRFIGDKGSWEEIK